jgi:hypothetical protein
MLLSGKNPTRRGNVGRKFFCVGSMYGMGPIILKGRQCSFMIWYTGAIADSSIWLLLEVTIESFEVFKVSLKR